MLTNEKRSITFTATSSVEVAEGDSTKEVAVEGYSCTIDSDNPGKMNVSKYYMSEEAKAVYKEHRAQCRADYAAFEDAAYAIQDEMIAEKAAQETA